MKQKKLLTKAVCFSAAFVMLMMSLTLELGIDLLNSWLRSSAEDNTSENTVAEIPINDNGYKIVETTEEVSIPTEVTFTWEEVTESFEELTPEPTTLAGDDVSDYGDADQTGNDENSEGDSDITELGEEDQSAGEDDILFLKSAVSDSKKYDSSNYTSASWGNFQAALDAANSILEKYNNNENVLKTEVDDAISNINTYGSLVKKLYTFSWKSKYVTASYQDGENNVVEIENGETELSAGTEVTVALTADGQNIYKSITLDKKSSDEESSSFIIDDSGEAIAKLTLRTTNVINNINVEGSDAPIITLPDNSNSVSYGQYIKVTPTAVYSVKVSNGNVTELIEKDKYVHVLGVQELNFTAERKSYDVSLINDAANYFTIDGIVENNKVSCKNGDEVVVKLKEKADINGINVESLLRSVTVSNIDEIKKDYDNCTITFTMPANNVEISCDTSKFEYQVTLPESTDGLEICYKTSDSDEYEELKSGTYLTEGTEVKVVLKNGYSWSVDVSVTYKNANGEETKVDLTSYNDDSGELIYTFKMPSSPITIEATAEKVKYGEIATENCSVEATTEDGAIVFDEDGNASFTVTPKTNDDSTIGYIVKSVKLNDKEVSDEDKSVNENGVWTVTFNKSGIHDDVNISVEYVVAVTLKIDRYDGKSSTSISSNGNSVTANYNYDNNGISSIEVTAEATTGYHITSFIEEPNTYPNTYKDTEAASGVNNNQYNKKATAVYSDVSTWTGTKEITVTFAIDTFNITAGESTGNGEISVPESPIKYDNNNETEDATVTATPNNDSYVSKIWCDNKLIFSTTVDDTVEEIDNISVDPDTSKNGSVDVKFSTVTADHTITAEFSDVEEVEPSGGLSFDDGSVVYSANLGSGAIYKYIIGGTNDENRSNLKLSFDNTDYSVSYFIGDINTAINSISYAGSCEVNSEKISFEEETNITFYLKNNSTYAVTKFTVTLVPDNEAPEIDTDTLKADPDYWTNGEVTIRGKVSDNGDVQSGVSKVYYRKGINGDFTLLSEDTDGNLETFEITLDEQNYNGVYQFYCVDRVGNESDTYDIQVQQDITAPTVDELIVDHDHNDWTNGKVTISGKVSDNLSGVAQVYYKRGDEEEFKQITTGTEQDDNGNITAFEITIDEQNYNGVYQFYCVDRAENMSDTSDIRVHQDITAPIVDSIEIDKNLLFTVIEKLTFGFYQAPITVTITASDPKPEEDENAVSEVKEIKYSYTGTNGKYSSEEVSGGSTVQVKDNKISFTVESDFRGTITATATDKAGNVSAVQKKINGMNKDGTTEELGGIVSDKTAPTLKDTYSEEKQIVNNIHYYDSNATLTIAITEANFYSEDVYVYVNGNKVDPDGAWKTNGDVHTNTVTLSGDGDYVVKVEYTDKSGNEMESYTSETIVVDKTKPIRTVTYSEPKQVVNAETLKSIKFNATSEGKNSILYCDGNATLTIAITEANFYADDVVFKVNDKAVSPDGAWKTNGDVHTNTLTLNNDGEYIVTIEYTDKSGNEMESYTSETIVVDKTKPIRTVTYSEPKQVVNAETLKSIKFNATSEGKNSILYYDGNATLSIAITEANFYSEDVYVYVNGNKADPDGAWKTNGDVHTNTVTLSGDGDYVVKVEYTDKSGNKMTSYESEKIVIDTIDPTIKVEYDNNDVKNTVDGIQYFDKQRTAIITVTEHNFRADDIDVTVSAVDVTGNSVSVQDYHSYLSNRSSWTKQDDVYTAKITYSADANYTFDISYKDLALNETADYSEDKFTVDKTAPYDLKVTYENEPENTVGSTRYYGEQVHVMISAADDASPIYRFEYEGKLTQNDPISAVNRSVLETIVESKTKEITREGNINKMDFYIPKELLNENNSFDGNVYFKAYDCAENNTDTTDATRLVTDKIAPTATVTFNGSEYTQKEYFNTNIDVNVSINEANFNSDDVMVSVTKDGSSYSGYSLKWNSSSVDSHLGSFTLTEDGDYVVTVTYTDKSGNKMQDYTSPVIVLDTVKPVVSIDPISGKSAHESAHNDETIGIKVAVTDKNIEAKDVELKLTAIINNNSDGAFVGKTIEIPIGEPTLSKNADGEMVLTYSIDNLEMDGYYTLKCNATDLATNENLDQTNEKHIIDDGKVQTEDIHFSVNRKGSVFWLEADCDGNTVDDINKDFNGQYLKAEVSVTFHEINVDPIPDENSTKKTLIKDNKEISDPDVEYSNDDVGSGGWYERKYTYQEENFEDDGRYTLRITTTDKAGNVNDSSTDDKSAAIRFTIDRTAPVIYSNVVEEQIDDGRYQGKTINKAEQTVEISFAEPNLDVEKLRIVRVDGENEEEIGDIHDLLDENNVVRFIENNVLNDNIKVYAYDLAGNKSTYDIVDLTVTTNIFALWYANTFIFWLSIIIFIVLAGLFILFIILKKRKRSEDEE